MCLCYQVKYWLEQLAGELQERLSKEAELVRFEFVSKALGPIAESVVIAPTIVLTSIGTCTF